LAQGRAQYVAAAGQYYVAYGSAVQQINVNLRRPGVSVRGVCGTVAAAAGAIGTSPVGYLSPSGPAARRGEKTAAGMAERYNGSHTYLTFRTPEGRVSSFYVPVAELPRFHRVVAAWKHFWKLAMQVAQINREEIVLSRPVETGRRAKHAGGA